MVYGENSRSYWYTGITSVGADDGTIGFVLVDTRTKEIKLYRQAGATETAAMRSAEGAIQEKKYNATFPVLYNVSGVPTYFTTLKDNEGLVKMVAWVSVEDYSIVGVGGTSKEALRSYRRKLMTKGNDLAPDSTVNRVYAEGRVLRIGKEPTLNGSNYYFLVEGYKNRLFVGSNGLSIEIVVTEVGDAIKMSYDDGGNEIVDMVSFDNLAIDLQKTVAQKKIDKRADTVRKRRNNERIGQNANSAWDNLSPKEKAKLLENKK